MKFRVITVTTKRQVEVPHGWELHHSTHIEGKHSFDVLLIKDEKPKEKNQKESAIGFDLQTDFED